MSSKYPSCIAQPDLNRSFQPVFLGLCCLHIHNYYLYRPSLDDFIQGYYLYMLLIGVLLTVKKMCYSKSFFAVCNT